MTEFCQRMLNDDEIDSPETCRERRRRRIEMRRVAAAAAAAASASASAAERISSPDSRQFRTGQATESSSSGGDETAEPCFGTLSVPGRSRYMEDIIDVRTALAKLEITRRMPVHFFAVYDGHGGSHVAELCKERMNVIVREEMERLRFVRGEEVGEREAEEEEWWWRRVMKRSFARMDEEAMNTCACGSAGFLCDCHPLDAPVGGSTAAVAVLTPYHIIVANVGDSRAVLCRRGLAVPLSRDHKPDRSDELARIQAAGGRVIFLNGARVEGILAMSRAIGDKYLKQYVISEPEITFTKRGPEDECLIIASDGLWDVLTSDMACRVAAECLRARPVIPGVRPPVREDERAAGALHPPSRSTLTAALLTRLALGRKSLDNISVIVVDLKRS